MHSKPLDIVYNPSTLAQVKEIFTRSLSEQESVHQWRQELQSHTTAELRQRIGGILEGEAKASIQSGQPADIMSYFQVMHVLPSETFWNCPTTFRDMCISHLSGTCLTVRVKSYLLELVLLFGTYPAFLGHALSSALLFLQASDSRISVKLDISAPHIIIPEDFEDKETKMVLFTIHWSLYLLTYCLLPLAACDTNYVLLVPELPGRLYH